MNTIKSLIIASAVFGASAAFAGDDPATEYLMDSSLISANSATIEVVDRAPVRNLGPTTEYLVESGLIEAPTMAVDGDLGDAPATVFSPEFKYWEEPAS